MAEDIKSIVTSRPDEGVVSTYATTSGADSPNVIVEAMSPLKIIAIRSRRAYVQAVLGFLTAGLKIGRAHV